MMDTMTQLVCSFFNNQSPISYYDYGEKLI
jgi:hypothetical protein